MLKDIAVEDSLRVAVFSEQLAVTSYQLEIEESETFWGCLDAIVCCVVKDIGRSLGVFAEFLRGRVLN